MDFGWKPEYDDLARRFLKQHFGGSGGLTHLFTCLRESYPWGSHRPPVIDPRIPAKNNTEYHGLETHAGQYHLTAQYEYAYHHWLLAACWRHEDMIANNLGDAGHQQAIEYCVKQALYNQTLHAWQQTPSGSVAPSPTQFGLTVGDIEKKVFRRTR